MCPCTQTWETSLSMKQTVIPAWITMPGETSFCTTMPAMGARTASSGLITSPCCSACLDLVLGVPKIFSACRLF